MSRWRCIDHLQELPICQAIEVFTDNTGVYRTFEATHGEGPQANGSTAARSTAIRSGQQSRLQLTQQQIKRLQDEKPAISVEAPSMEAAMNAARGTQWLALLTNNGDLQVCGSATTPTGSYDSSDPITA